MDCGARQLFSSLWTARVYLVAMVVGFVLSACVISSDVPVFDRDDYSVIEGLDGLWRQVETSEGSDDDVVFRIAHMGSGRYRALAFAEVDTGADGEETSTTDDEPVDFAFVALGEEAYILVSPESSGGGDMSVVYLGAEISEGNLKTYLFGGGEDAQKDALIAAIEEAGLSLNPNFNSEIRLQAPISKEAFKSFFVQIMSDPVAYGAYWTRYERVGD